MTDTPRHVLVISPEPWNGVHVSKHVLAETLARTGHRVCFWEPPVSGDRGLRIRQDRGVHVVHQAHWLRGVNRLPRAVQAWYYGRSIRRIETALGHPFDTIWCFDTTRMQEFPDRSLDRILHLVDYDTLDTGDGLVRTADLVLTVSEPISDHARRSAPNADIRTVGHMVDARWLDLARTEPHAAPPRTAAYAGNLSPKYLDWPMLITIMERHPEIHFDMYGPVTQGGDDPDLATARGLANTTFHGLIPKDQLIPKLHDADLLIFCYKAYLLKAIASNHHKVLEYLATGNVTVGSHVAAHEGTTLFLMAREREEYIGCFDQACADFAALNASELRAARIEHARQHTMNELVRSVWGMLAKT